MHAACGVKRIFDDAVKRSFSAAYYTPIIFRSLGTNTLIDSRPKEVQIHLPFLYRHVLTNRMSFDTVDSLLSPATNVGFFVNTTTLNEHGVYRSIEYIRILSRS